MFAVDNKTSSKNSSKSRGRKLKDQADAFAYVVSGVLRIATRIIGEDEDGNLIKERDKIIFVKEALSPKYFTDTITMAMSHAIAECSLEVMFNGEERWEELHANTVKKVITGNGKATKEEVAEKLKDVFGEIKYEVDDESDAVALGLAWLLLNCYEVAKAKDVPPAIEHNNKEGDKKDGKEV